MAAFVKSVERVTVSFTNTSGSNTQTVALTKGQDPDQCVPLSTILRFTGAGQDQRANNCVGVDIYDNAGTATVDVNRTITSSGGWADVEICVVEFADTVTVQKGTASLTGTSATATITAVNQDNAFAIVTAEAQTTGSGDDFNDYYIQAKFNSNTQLGFTRRASGNPDWDIYWYVVESNGTDFQTEYLEINGGQVETGPTNVSLTNSVNLDHSFIICSYESSEVSDDQRDATWSFALTGTTTLTYYRNNGSFPSAEATFGIWVVRSDSDGCNVQRFATDVDGQTTTNQAITSVDTDFAAIAVGHTAGQGVWPINSSTNGTDNYRYQSTITITSATNVALQRFSQTSVAGSNNFIRYEVVEFGEAGAGQKITAEEGTFTWSGQDADLQYSSILTAEAGNYAFSGQDAGLSRGFVLDAETGAYSWTGFDADLSRTTVITLTAEEGTFSFTGQDANLEYNRLTFAEQGNFSFAGESADLAYGRRLGAETGTFSFVGENASLRTAEGIMADTGFFAWSGEDATLRADRVLTAEVGTFSFSGFDAVLRYIRPGTIMAEEGVFSFQGHPAQLGEEEEQPAGWPRKPKRKPRRYILPDNRVFTDPDRALFELRQLLAQNEAPVQSPSGAGLPVTLPQEPASLSLEGPAPDEAPSANMVSAAVQELPDLIEARSADAQPIDPQLLSVLFQRIDDEEAAMLLL